MRGFRILNSHITPWVQILFRSTIMKLKKIRNDLEPIAVGVVPQFSRLDSHNMTVLRINSNA